MQRTSKAYRTEQKQHLRNEQYVNVYLGLVSREAQASAVAEGTFTLYADITSIYGNPTFEAYYATCEENQAKVDGSMFFMPRDTDAFALYQGLVTEKECDSVIFTFGEYKHLNIKGLTIDFGDYYPTSFEVTNGTATCTYEYENFYPGKWSTEDEFIDSAFIKITPHSMVGGRQKLRILSMMFGIGLVFDNFNLINTSFTSYIAHLSESLPTKTFTWTVDNLNRMYSADNPHSYVAFFQEQQDVIFDYGRKLDDGTIFRMAGGKMNLSSWSSNDQQAKFTAVGYMDYSTGKYNKGQYYPNGITLYDLAVDVCEDAGFEKYKIDTYLKKLTTHNPLPVETHKNLLQLIANASLSVLWEDREGNIEIKSSFLPEITNVSCNGETEYSNVADIVDKDAKIFSYGTAEKDFTYSDAHQYFLPRNSSAGYLKVGYVSENVSDSEGYFPMLTTSHLFFVHEGGRIDDMNFNGDTVYAKFVSGGYSMPLNEHGTRNPEVVVEWEASWTFFDLSIVFNDVAPKIFIVRTYKDNVEQEMFTIDEDITLTTLINHDFYNIDKISFEFVQTNPYQRIHIAKILFGKCTDYILEYQDMSATPVATRTDYIRNIDVVYSEYSYGDTVKSISTVDAGDSLNTVEFSKPHHDYSLSYKELKDDEAEYSKVSKVFVDELPSVDDAKSSSYYFVGSAPYDLYVIETEDKIKQWVFKASVTESRVNSLPGSLNNNVLYLVKTDTPLIYHAYMTDVRKDEPETISLGYIIKGTLTITDSGAYYVSFTTDVNSPVVVSGIEFNVSEKSVTTHQNDIGVDKTATNVLIDTEERAARENSWLAEYYNNDVEYTIQYRGEPMLDPDDFIYTENRFVEENLIRIASTKIDTSTGMSINCTLKGRRLSYTEAAVVGYAIVDVSEVSV